MPRRSLDLTEHLKMQQHHHNTRCGLMALLGRRRMGAYVECADMGCFRTFNERLGLRRSA